MKNFSEHQRVFSALISVKIFFCFSQMIRRGVKLFLHNLLHFRCSIVLLFNGSFVHLFIYYSFLHNLLHFRCSHVLWFFGSPIPIYLYTLYLYFTPSQTSPSRYSFPWPLQQYKPPLPEQQYQWLFPQMTWTMYILILRADCKF